MRGDEHQVVDVVRGSHRGLHGKISKRDSDGLVLMGDDFSCAGCAGDGTRLDEHRIARSDTAACGRSSASFDRLHEDFWTEFRAYTQAQKLPVYMGRIDLHHRKRIGLKRPGTEMFVELGARDQLHRLSLHVYGSMGVAWFEHLRTNYEGRLAAELGPLEWQTLPFACVISQEHFADPSTRGTWPSLHGWLAETILRWMSVLKPIVAALPSEPPRS